MRKSITRFIAIFLKWAIYIALFVGSIRFFAMLSTVHGKNYPADHFANGHPSIIALLNSELFMGVIFIVTLGVFAFVGKLLWQLHEVAVHKSQHNNSVHTTLVFALSLCGLFINKAYWVAAIVIAFTRWDMIGKALSDVIHLGVHGKSRQSESTSENV
ncbi:magnesium transporter [Vibrio ulleungensis]|uniref:Magnesium transporter n=1 Tax=Vibrio ulleungensis TaxID=2807619 RepID=A0ABS2HJD5_9VIBR|nr:magnesium transporter [Vibrio ulleungensis]MBM7036771.1 magnesium transporter [Vibrio ulleungensis]